MAKQTFKKNLTHIWEDKGFIPFLKGICPKVNMISRLEFELAYYHSTVQSFNHYTTITPPLSTSLMINYL